MLQIRVYETEVTELHFTTMVLGRPMYAVSAYFFDGALIDSGPQRTGRELAAWAANQPVTQIINTHHHEDHVGGNSFLNVPISAPAGTIPILSHPPRLPLYRWLTFGRPRPVTASPYLATIATPHHTLQAIATPGHAADHVALLLPNKGWLFGGDLFLMERAKYVRGEDNVAQWLQSLHLILDYDFDTLFCSHAGQITNGKAAIRRKIAYWQEIGAKAKEMADSGRSLPTIRDTLLGPEGFLTWFSWGRFSKLNLIRALLAATP